MRIVNYLNVSAMVWKSKAHFIESGLKIIREFHETKNITI